MIVVSQNFVLNGQDDVERTDTDLNNPVIGYDNIVSADTLTVTSEEFASPATNLLNFATNLFWEATSTAVQYLTITTNTSDDIDYVGLFGHNFNEAGIAVSLEEDTGSGWEEIVEAFQPGDSSPILLRFTPGPRVGLRVKLHTGDTAALLSVFYCGKLLVLERRIYVGHTPITFGRNPEVVNGVSDGGHFLGRIIVGETLSTNVELSNITPLWYRTKMDPFVQAAQEMPFFFGWRPTKYPNEIGFSWLQNSPKPVNQRPNGMMRISLELGGASL